MVEGEISKPAFQVCRIDGQKRDRISCFVQRTDSSALGFGLVFGDKKLGVAENAEVRALHQHGDETGVTTKDFNFEPFGLHLIAQQLLSRSARVIEGVSPLACCDVNGERAVFSAQVRGILGDKGSLTFVGIADVQRGADLARVGVLGDAPRRKLPDDRINAPRLSHQGRKL